ncbi:MAG: hypothetical protein E7474_02960 [Ruminococcaceae bacterium]|nr:hypothetical protein [Oscillospiraceae bacterium]
MASGGRYYWMKLKKDFMYSDVIDYIMNLPDGARYVVLYQMLCLKTINTFGRLSNQICKVNITYDIEKLSRDCKWFSTLGNLTGYDCPKCLNRGIMWGVRENDEVYTCECECMVQRRNLERLKRSGLEDAVKRYTFDSWKTPDRWQEKAKTLAQQYARERQGWFITYGHVGSGKTHLCTAICAELLNVGMDTLYMLWRDVAVQAKAAIMDDEAYTKIVSPLKRVKVLYIDDLFKVGKGKPPTEGDVNLAFEIINNRYNDSSKLTIISTELSMEDLLDIDEAVGSRIYERSKGFRLSFEKKPNWRLLD